MSRRNPPAKWVLPQTVDPPERLCFKIEVPNERYHIAAFLGALQHLASAIYWQDDTAHTAKDVALVWRDIIDAVERDNCEDCPEPPKGEEVIEDMGIRVDCDCNVWITCPDGSEMQIATKDMIGLPAQTGGEDTPPDAGQCKTYHATLNGNSTYYAPFVVSTGDTIEITNAIGATYDPAGGIWFCPTGNQYFAGQCVPQTYTAGGNPVPAAFTGKIVAKIGATFYDVFNGVYTVPAGITNQPVTFQINYASIASSGGQVTFDLRYCNNAANHWTHTFDFTLSNYGWTIPSGFTNVPCVWQAGIGWQSNQCVNLFGTGALYTLVSLQKSLSSPRTITGIQLFYTSTLGSNAFGDTTRFNVAVGATDNFIINHAPSAAPVADDTWSGAIANATRLAIAPLFAHGSAPGGCVTSSARLTKIIVQGLGTDPF